MATPLHGKYILETSLEPAEIAIVAMVRIAVLGATGYSAKELIRLLLAHPHAQIAALTTRQDDKPHVGDVHPLLRGRLDLRLENLEPSEVAKRAECVFCCLPHAASAEVIKDLLAAGSRVVDFSADERLIAPS